MTPAIPLRVLNGFGDGTSLLLALGIGIVFGWFLERGGMGDARKLSGQFYLRDFAVFKVMFAAILTALLGLFWFARIGWVDASLVYIPETFLLPQLAGGVVFGIGFVMAGLCPGTSCVAAATGHIDGLAAAGGMLLGVLVFAEFYPRLAAFHASTARGTLTLPAVTGLPVGVVIFLITIAGIGGFAVAERIERGRTA
jgi:uncharacterized membrane protein YedE/YeeE